MLAEGETHIQGLINLADNREDDGGFHCVPGCHKYIEDIARATADTIGTWYGPLQSFIVSQPASVRALPCLWGSARVRCLIPNAIAWRGFASGDLSRSNPDACPTRSTSAGDS